jgi:putative endonuclease
MPRSMWVYILGSKSGVLYIGVTNDLQRRVAEHKCGEFDGFTRKYRCERLLYYEVYHSPRESIAREKQLKRWSRIKKLWLIDTINSEREDLAKDWMT